MHVLYKNDPSPSPPSHSPAPIIKPPPLILRNRFPIRIRRGGSFPTISYVCALGEFVFCSEIDA